MQKQKNIKKQSRSIALSVSFFIWLVINIRVEAGIATTFERGVDGLVGGVVLLGAIFLALQFFRFIGEA